MSPARVYSPFRHLPSAFLNTGPVQLTLFLTRRCNARCRFCFYLSPESISRRETPSDSAEELTVEEIRKISKSMGSLLWLAFSGGEPYLRQDLAEIAEVFYRRNRPCIILVPTNGLLPDVIVNTTVDILKRCSRSTVAVKLSVDGSADVHDRLRGVPGAFRKTMQTFSRLRELLPQYPNFELGFNSVLCSENQHEMDGLIDSVGQLEGVRAHTISLIRGDVEDGRLKEVDAAVYARLGDRLAKNIRSRTTARYRFSGAGLKAAQDIVQRRLIHKTLLEGKRQVPCTAGKLSLVLTETGDAYPCESFAMKMGNIRDHGCDVKKLLESDPAMSSAASVRQSGCHCTHECNTMMNVLFNPALYPELMREYLKLA